MLVAKLCSIPNLSPEIIIIRYRREWVSSPLHTSQPFEMCLKSSRFQKLQPSLYLQFSFSDVWRARGGSSRYRSRSFLSLWERSEQFCGLRVDPSPPPSPTLIPCPVPSRPGLYPLLIQSVHPATEYYILQGLITRPKNVCCLCSCAWARYVAFLYVLSVLVKCWV